MKTEHDSPDSQLIGYFAKKTMTRADWPRTESVEEICSASTCMSRADWDWINEWRHNEMWVYDTPDLAMGVVPLQEHVRCDLYAYGIFPVRFVEGDCRNFPLPEVNPVLLPDDFERLGFDLVSRSYDNAFECSPLSCNGLAEEVPVNRFCLLNTEDEAFALAPTMEVPGQPMRGEPGPYYVVEVWRKRRPCI